MYMLRSEVDTAEAGLCHHQQTVEETGAVLLALLTCAEHAANRMKLTIHTHTVQIICTHQCLPGIEAMLTCMELDAADNMLGS